MEVMENIREVLSANLRRERKKAGFTSSESLAEAADVSVGMIKKVELGEIWPSPEIIEKVASALKVHSAKLYNTKEPALEGSVLKAVSSVPNEVYELAAKLGPNTPIWESIIELMRAELRGSKKGKGLA